LILTLLHLTLGNYTPKEINQAIKLIKNWLASGLGQARLVRQWTSK